MIEVIPSKESDMERFENDTDLSNKSISDAITFSRKHPDFRTIFTLWDTDTHSVVAFIGMNLIVNGVYEFYVIKSKQASQKALEMWKEIDYALSSFFETKIIHRAQIAVSVENEKYIKFLERFKFLPEGVMKNYYGDGKDQMLLARV